MSSRGIFAFVVPTARSEAVDVAFLLDSSGSVGKDNWRTLLDFVKDVINKFVVGPAHAQFATAIFSTESFVVFHLGRVHPDTMLGTGC